MPISPGYAAPTLARFADSFNFVCAADVQPITKDYTFYLWLVPEDEGQQSARSGHYRYAESRELAYSAMYQWCALCLGAAARCGQNPAFWYRLATACERVLCACCLWYAYIDVKGVRACV